MKLLPLNEGHPEPRALGSAARLGMSGRAPILPQDAHAVPGYSSVVASTRPGVPLVAVAHPWPGELPPGDLVSPDSWAQGQHLPAAGDREQEARKPQARGTKTSMRVRSMLAAWLMLLGSTRPAPHGPHVAALDAWRTRGHLSLQTMPQGTFVCTGAPPTCSRGPAAWQCPGRQPFAPGLRCSCLTQLFVMPDLNPRPPIPSPTALPRSAAASWMHPKPAPLSPRSPGCAQRRVNFSKS